MTFHELLAVSEVPCRDPKNDVGLWFGDSNDEDEQYGTEDAAKAAGLCVPCPIKHACLQYAITTNEYWGVWGATTPAQRDRLRQQGRR